MHAVIYDSLQQVRRGFLFKWEATASTGYFFMLLYGDKKGPAFQQTHE